MLQARAMIRVVKDWHKISLVCCSDVAGTGDDQGGERLAQDQSSLLQ